MTFKSPTFSGSGGPQPRHRNRLFAAALAASFLLVSGANAQNSSGTLVGTVLDASGGAVPDAKVEAKNNATGIVSSSNASGTGSYTISFLLAGTYTVTASGTGFSSASIGNVVVEANKIITQNFTLAVGQVTTNIEVTAGGATIDTTTATIQNTFDTQLTRDLPITSIGLGAPNLALLSAGVASNGGIGAGEGPSVGGQRPRNNNFMIEGIDDNNKSVTGSLVRFVPNDAVEEFTVLQNQESAQYGHSSGGQFNAILHSGGNAFHGTLYDYMQNKNLNAIDQQIANSAIAAGDKPANSRLDENRFGGSIGGPILKNKLFFYGLYDYQPAGLSGTVASVSAPTAAGYSALSGIPGLNQTNLGILKQYLPAAASATDSVTVAGRSIPIGGIGVTAPNYQNNTDVVATFDYNISDKDQLRGRYIYNRLAQIDVGANLSAFYTFNNNVYHLASLAEFHNFTPSLTNEFRLGFARLNQPLSAGNFKYPGLDAFPNIVLFDLGIDIGPSDNAPQTTVQNNYQIVDNVSWVKGRHTFQFGFDGRKYISPGTFTQRSRGDYEYNSLELFLQDGIPDALAQRSLGNPVYYGDQIATYEYFQDNWRVRPNLTVNLGVRYERTTVPYSARLQTLNAISNVPGVFVFGEPKVQNTNWAPRIGFAYSPGTSGNTSIRAGFGMAYDVIYDNIGILDLPPQLSTTVDCATAGLCSAPFLTNGGLRPNLAGSSLSAAAARANTASWIPDQKLPYSIQWNVGVQHVFHNNYTLDVRYLGTRGIHLDVQDRQTVQAGVRADRTLPLFFSAPSQASLNALPLTLAQLTATPKVLPLYANAGFTNAALVVNNPIGNSSYNGLAVQLNRRFSNGLQFQAAYTWSHNIDDSTADFNTTALSPRRAQDFQDYSSERATSALDRRQRFSFLAYYETPWFKKSNWFAKNLIGNWTLVPIYTYETPEYFTPQSAVDSNSNGDSAGDRVYLNPNGVEGTGGTVSALKNSAGDTVAFLANNPNAKYIKAPVGLFPNAGRNLIPGRPIDNVDMNFIKSFSVTERWKVQFQAQFFNLFNHAQFLPGFANRADNPAVLANGTADKNYMTPGNIIFNNPEAVFGSNSRSIQLALKLIF